MRIQGRKREEEGRAVVGWTADEGGRRGFLFFSFFFSFFSSFFLFSNFQVYHFFPLVASGVL